MGDGRLLKGQLRRRALMDATIRVIGRAGVAGVSQRVVAAEAGVPPSAVAYYFPAVADLLLAVLADVNDAWIAALERCAAQDDPLTALARLVATAGEDATRSPTAAEFELFLLAGKDGRAAAEYARWAAALDAVVTRHQPDPTRAAAACAAVDGLLMRCYCDPGAFDPTRLRAILAAALEP